MRIKAVAFVVCMLVLAMPCQAQTLNSKLAVFLSGKVGLRVGGGECAHAATEGLRVAGAEFTSADLGPDSPAPGDYVWGTLIKTVSNTNGTWVDSKPASKLQPGDIIQYRNTKFVYPTYSNFSSQHTSIVANVNAAGSPTFVYEENFNKVRVLRKNAINLRNLASGTVRIYRPKRRGNKTGQTKFTITNNMPSSQTMSINLGTSSLGSFSLTSANTLTSYQIRWATVTGTATPFTLKLSTGQSITLTNAGGYEIYKTASGSPALRKLSP